MSKQPICVNRKILADIGRGIYRSPANAMKELVSNAFDACATLVEITTNAPYFDVFTCEDNGHGIEPEQFKTIMSNIGSSNKRAGRNETITCDGKQRPIIGKIGIGLMAVAQICDKFTIISKQKGKDTAFQADIDLRQFDEDDAYNRGEGDIKLGEYDIDEEIPVFEEEIDISYTRVIMVELKEGFRRKLMDIPQKELNLRPYEKARTSTDFASLITDMNRMDYLQKAVEYDLMIWELGLFCPIQYWEDHDGVFPTAKYIKSDIERLKGYQFRLFVDGLEIRKSTFFGQADKIRNEGEDFKIYTLPQFDDIVAERPLRFHGYIYTQRTKIKPTELQGILIRIKDVGIGSYDKSILGYPRQEGPIFSMISGEVFVENGLEDALNMTRNDFNGTHPHYQKLQSVIHKFVREEMMQDIRKRSRERLKREREERLSRQLVEFPKKMDENWGIQVVFDTAEEQHQTPYSFATEARKLTFFMNAKGWATSEKDRLAQIKSISALFLIRTSHSEADADKIISELIFRTK